MYDHDDKLNIDVSEIDVTANDFQAAMESITPAAEVSCNELACLHDPADC